MEKKTEQKVAVNPSSGAEKVENIQKELAKEQSKPAEKPIGEKKITEKTVKKATAKPQSNTAKKKEKEQAAAKRRIAAAMRKKRAKENREKVKAERKARKEERMRLLAAKKEARRAKQAAARRDRELHNAKAREARLEKMRAIREEREKRRQDQRIERAALKAERRAAAKRKRADVAKKKTETGKKSRHEHQRAKGFSGWLAAVVVLGTLTLGLGTAAAVGAVNAAKMSQAMMMGYKGTLYELAGLIDNLDGDLDKVRLSTTKSGQDRYLTDMLVQARLAEMSLEKLPVGAETEENLTSFINRTAKAAEEMIVKLRSGEALNERDQALLRALYETNRAVRMKLDEAIANLTDDDMMEMMKKGCDSKVGETMRAIEDATLPENHPNKETFQRGEVKEEKDGLDVSSAQTLCETYFKGYAVTETEYVGETLSKGMQTYNFRLKDEQMREIFAQLDKRSGALVEFDFYEDCTAQNYTLEDCESLAENFLARLGYGDLTCVYGKQSGVAVDYVFVYEQDGTVYYPDEVKVKVCMEKGLVIGLDGRKFLQNHRPRAGFNGKFSQNQARERIAQGAEITSEQQVLLATRYGEKYAYEFFVNYGEEQYLIYIDAQTGGEISIVNVKDLLV